MHNLKMISWNIRGMNSPQKRRKVFQYLKKQNADVICLQETHIKEKDIRLLENRRLGKEFISANSKKKNGVVMYINNRFNVKKLLEDTEGRYIGLEVTFPSGKYMIIGLYAPLDKKEQFYDKLNKDMCKFSYEKTIIMGDWNGVVDPEIDRKSQKKIKKTQGKLPKSFENLIEEQALHDIWRYKHQNSKDFTYFSERHKSLSRIDMMFATRLTCKDVVKMNFEPRTISDHSPIVIEIRTQQTDYTWRLNLILLQKEEITTRGKEALKLFFEENMKEDIDVTTVWEASKAYMRGFFHSTKLYH